MPTLIPPTAMQLRVDRGLTDPRGSALTIAPVDAGMTDSNYSSVGVTV